MSKLDAKNPYVLGAAAIAAIYGQRRYDILDWLRLGWIETGSYPTNTTQANSSLTELANIQSRANSLGQSGLSTRAQSLVAKIAAQFPGASTTVVPSTTTTTKPVTSGSGTAPKPKTSTSTGTKRAAVTVTVSGKTASYLENANTAAYLATLPRSVVVVAGNGRKFANDPNTRSAVAAGTL